MTSVPQRIGHAWLRALEPALGGPNGHHATARALRSARIGMFPEWYFAVGYGAAAVLAVVLGVGTWGALVIQRALNPYADAALALALAVFAFFCVRLAFLAYPRLKAQGRARRIDAEMPAIVTMCYALARGNVAPMEIMRTVANEKRVYGEAAVEFGVVVRNVDWLGLDLVAALQDAASTTPSTQLRAFLDGLVTMLNSGAQAEDYFMHQAKTELGNAELGLAKELEQASMLAEIYVSGLLVLPLLLMVVISGLAPLAAGQTAIMPFIVFAFIPLGTLVYLVLVDTLLPSEALATPLPEKSATADFGLATVPADTPLLPPPWETSWPNYEPKEAKKLHRQLAFERARLKFVHGLARFNARMLARPTDALRFSLVLGAIVAAAGAAFIMTRGLAGDQMAIVATGVAVAAVTVAALPVSVYHEIRVRRARHVEEALPDNLQKLAGFNERGIGLLQSFQILGTNASGALAKEFRAVERDVSWNGSLANALRRMRERVNTLRMTKVALLLERASAATGSLREVLDIAASDATKRESLRSTRRQSMLSYVVVIYIVFAVFLYVLFTVANLFYGPGGLGDAVSRGAGSAGLSAPNARLLFAQAAVIQGICCGMVAGRLGEGYTLSGLKHAAILGAIAYAVFLWGVLS